MVAKIPEAYDREFRAEAKYIAHRRIAVLIIAGVLWGRFLWLLFAPHDGYPGECPGPLFADSNTSEFCLDAGPQWPEVLGVLALAVVPTVIGTVILAYARLVRRMVRYREGIERFSPRN